MHWPRCALLGVLIAGAIQAGEPHWAFRPLAQPPAHASIDRVIAQKLATRGWTLAPEAARGTLIRRLSLDLIGLPPSPQEVDAFVIDQRADAYERLVDRLLASPHFGERWGRHWLDAAGYVDVMGVDNDAGTVKLAENKWLYRDYVIRSFNDDKPLAQFLTEQIAGDELVDWRTAAEYTPRIREALIATGFLRIAADDTDENELNTLDIRHGVLQRTGEIVASNLLALTFQCAKCHDHKYEPILQRDYYRWLALFQPVFDPQHWLQPKDRRFPDLPAAQRRPLEQANAKLDAKIAACEALKKKEPNAKSQIDREVERLRREKHTWGHWQAAYESGPPSPTHVLKRGQHDTPGDAVTPGFPQLLGAANDGDPEPSARNSSSGRRTALARWLTDPNTPAGSLVWRVQVNRVWQHLFGVGLVPSSDNFGLTGQRPTHPELLDRLAAEFRDNGGRLKPLIRCIVTSAVYRQSSAIENSDARRLDPDNSLLWRQRLRRLESEAVRDALLVAGGQVDRTMFGPPIPVDSKPDGSFAIRGPSRRRSVYLLARRNYHPTLLGVFDQPTIATNCTMRTASAVVLQSLTMLNDSFVAAQAEQLAAGLRTGPESLQVENAFRRILGRKPEADELEWSLGLLHRHSKRETALVHLCRMLMNTSEFLYVP